MPEKSLSVSAYADRVADMHRFISEKEAAEQNRRVAQRSLDAHSTLFFKCPPLTTQLVYPPVDTSGPL